MLGALKSLAVLALVCVSSAETQCVAGSCQDQIDETSLLQVKQTVSPGGERLEEHSKPVVNFASRASKGRLTKKRAAVALKATVSKTRSSEARTAQALMAAEALAQDAAMAAKFVQEAEQDVAAAAKLAGRARRQEMHASEKERTTKKAARLASEKARMATKAAIKSSERARVATKASETANAATKAAAEASQTKVVLERASKTARAAVNAANEAAAKARATRQAALQASKKANAAKEASNKVTFQTLVSTAASLPPMFEPVTLETLGVKEEIVGNLLDVDTAAQDSKAKDTVADKWRYDGDGYGDGYGRRDYEDRDYREYRTPQLEEERDDLREDESVIGRDEERADERYDDREEDRQDERDEQADVGDIYDEVSDQDRDYRDRDYDGRYNDGYDNDDYSHPYAHRRSNYYRNYGGGYDRNRNYYDTDRFQRYGNRYNTYGPRGRMLNHQGVSYVPHGLVEGVGGVGVVEPGMVLPGMMGGVQDVMPGVPGMQVLPGGPMQGGLVVGGLQSCMDQCGVVQGNTNRAICMWGCKSSNSAEHMAGLHW